MGGHAEEEVVGYLAAVPEDRHPSSRVESADNRVWMPIDATLSERRQQRLGHVGRRRDGERERHDQRNLGAGHAARTVRKSCINNAVSLGAGGHLNGVEVTATTTRPPSKAASTS